MHATMWDSRTLLVAGLSTLHTLYGSVLPSPQADTLAHVVRCENRACELPAHAHAAPCRPRRMWLCAGVSATCEQSAHANAACGCVPV